MSQPSLPPASSGLQELPTAAEWAAHCKRQALYITYLRRLLSIHSDLSLADVTAHVAALSLESPVPSLPHTYEGNPLSPVRVPAVEAAATSTAQHLGRAAAEAGESMQGCLHTLCNDNSTESASICAGGENTTRQLSASPWESSNIGTSTSLGPSTGATTPLTFGGQDAQSPTLVPGTLPGSDDDAGTPEPMDICEEDRNPPQPVASMAAHAIRSGLQKSQWSRCEKEYVVRAGSLKLYRSCRKHGLRSSGARAEGQKAVWERVKYSTASSTSARSKSSASRWVPPPLAGTKREAPEDDYPPHARGPASKKQKQKQEDENGNGEFDHDGVPAKDPTLAQVLSDHGFHDKWTAVFRRASKALPDVATAMRINDPMELVRGAYRFHQLTCQLIGIADFEMGSSLGNLLVAARDLYEGYKGPLGIKRTNTLLNHRWTAPRLHWQLKQYEKDIERFEDKMRNAWRNSPDRTNAALLKAEVQIFEIAGAWNIILEYGSDQGWPQKLASLAGKVSTLKNNLGDKLDNMVNWDELIHNAQHISMNFDKSSAWAKDLRKPLDEEFKW
ncbi:hypothetical protein NA57DRAFT_57392 [Rhizodiscina lignyota]|uniref:Uncharacterized protein n=1 Tax=Rhizodiscina lignyota TaxID=1504668 RepID=A0A9P4M9X9_9PEZI|nr:hypothetical protein NA57DRAFT_57392 [Rhizodiscina lignyota]